MNFIMGNVLFLLYRREFYLPILMQFADSITKLNIKIQYPSRPMPYICCCILLIISE